MIRIAFALATSTTLCFCLLACSFENAIAQEGKTLRVGTLFERTQALEVASPPAGQPLVAISGTVRNPDYTPAKAIVICWRIENEVATVLAKAITNELGRYSLDVMPSVKEHEQFQFFAIDADNQMAWGQAYVRLDSNPRLSFVLRESTGRIEGTLIAPGDKPISGVEVALDAWLEPHAVFGGSFPPFDFHGISDTNGHFEIDGLPARVIAAFAVRSKEWGSLTALMPTTVDAPMDRLPGSVRTTIFFSTAGKLKLYPKCDIRGSVVDFRGNPVAAATVGFLNDAITDEHGEFTISRPDFDAVGSDENKDYFENLQVSPPAGSKFMVENALFRREELTARRMKPIVLRGEFLSGRILSATTKKPLQFIRIRTSDRAHEAISDVDGTFRILVLPGQKEIFFTPPWMSNSEQQNFLLNPKARGKRDIDVLDGEPVDMGTVLLDVDPSAVKPITIKVISERRTPIADCRLELTKMDDPMRGKYQASLVDGDSIVQHIVTNRIGMAVLKPASGWGQFKQDRPANLANTRLANTVTASFQGRQANYFGSVNIDEVTDEVVELTLTEGVRITGQVLLNGLPLEGVTVNANTAAPSGQLSRTSSETDEKGEYTVYLPVAKGYELAYLQGFPMNNYSISISKFQVQPTDDPLLFVVPPIEIVTGSGEVRGTVVDSDGKPAANAIVGCNGPNNQIWIPRRLANNTVTSFTPTFTTKTDTAGNFLLTDLPDGAHHLLATDATNDSWRDKTRITKDVEAEIGSKDIRIVLP